MYFLIDYENVNNNGMQGCKYLLPEDTLEIFYSMTSTNISSRVFDTIAQSGCTLKICKLQNPRKNALDFYIASRLGELIGKGHQETMVIISHDKGYKAVMEYWRVCAEVPRQIYLASTITEGIVSANENTPRTKLAHEDKKQVPIETEFEKYEKTAQNRKIIENHFSNTVYDTFIDDISCLFEHHADMRTLYLSCLKRFGRTDGGAIYNMIKKLKGENTWKT